MLMALFTIVVSYERSIISHSAGNKGNIRFNMVEPQNNVINFCTYLRTHFSQKSSNFGIWYLYVYGWKLSDILRA